MQINFEYLNKLKHPHYAITADYWNKIRTDLYLKISRDERFKNLEKIEVPEIARRLGLVWPNKSEADIKSLLSVSLDQIIEKPFAAEEWKKTYMLMMVKLIDCDDETLERVSVYIEPSELAEIEKARVYEATRPIIRAQFKEMLNELTNDNFEEKLQQLYKSIFATIITACKYKTKDPGKYINLMLAKFFDRLDYNQVKEKMNVHGTVLNSITQRFIRDFNEIFGNHEEMVKLVTIYEKIENQAFDILEIPNGDDYIARNERLWKLTGFRDQFIGENLKRWVD